MGVARSEIGVFFRQLFGFQPDAGQGRGDYDLITRSHFPPETQKSSDQMKTSELDWQKCNDTQWAIPEQDDQC